MSEKLTAAKKSRIGRAPSSRSNDAPGTGSLVARRSSPQRTHRRFQRIIAQCATWQEVSAIIGDDALLVRLIALFGRDPDGSYGLAAARASGDPDIVKTAAASIIEDWRAGEPRGVAYMQLSPVV